MKFPVRRARPPADWQLPLVNIVFLMLMFFVTNGTISNIHDSAITLPSSVTVTDSGAVGDAAYLDAAGRLTFRGRPASPRDIAAAWNAETQDGPARRPLQVAADRAAPARLLLDNLDGLRAAGVTAINLITIRSAEHVE